MTRVQQAAAKAAGLPLEHPPVGGVLVLSQMWERPEV
jgi:hypothetical protein